ncbi:MAG: hypothetical protein IKZ95_00460 [Lachnospiraceae bacterium]|nr:hypothetical protein [Lachnospiraceae bacterium]
MKKPKLWNIAILTGLLIIALLIMVISRKTLPLSGICLALFVYLLLVLLCLADAFFRQLKYNLYSYNTAYYPGFFLFVLLLAISHGVITLKVLSSLGSVDLFQVITKRHSSLYHAGSSVFLPDQ